MTFITKRYIGILTASIVCVLAIFGIGIFVGGLSTNTKTVIQTDTVTKTKTVNSGGSVVVDGGSLAQTSSAFGSKPYAVYRTKIHGVNFTCAIFLSNPAPIKKLNFNTLTWQAQECVNSLLVG